MVLTLNENEFALLCVRPLQKDENGLIISKATFDCKTFYDIPPAFQSMENHKELSVSILLYYLILSI